VNNFIIARKDKIYNLAKFIPQADETVVNIEINFYSRLYLTPRQFIIISYINKIPKASTASFRQQNIKKDKSAN